jgi:hypothetical protein
MDVTFLLVCKDGYGGVFAYPLPCDRLLRYLVSMPAKVV